MTNAGPTSTDSTTERAEKADGQSLVAVSEENLAALLRATRNPSEPELQQPDAAPTPEPEMEVKEAASATGPVASAPAEEILTPEPAFVPTPVTTPVAVPVAQREYPAASLPAEAAPIQVTLPKSRPVVAATPTPMPAPSRNGLLMGGIGGALILVVGLLLLWPKGHPAKALAPTVTVAAPTDNAPLQVLAEPLGNGLINVRWNAQSPSVAQARDGRLVITEQGKTPRIMALDVEQLKIGHLTYQSAAESIEFDLEVTDRSGGVAKESILAMGSQANEPVQHPREPVATPKPQAVAQAVAPKTQTPPPPPVQAAVEVPQQTSAKARTFVPPPSQQKKEQRAVIDAPPALASSPATPVGVNLTASMAAISAPTAAAPKPIRVESTLQAGNLIKKVVPIYPVLAKSAGVEGVVRFTALIGKDGKIQNLKLLSGPSALVSAASDAVRRWEYRPTLLDGQPVEVITQINVNFTATGVTR